MMDAEKENCAGWTRTGDEAVGFFDSWGKAL